MAEEIEWWDFDSVEDLIEGVVGDVSFIIESALDARGQALVAFPGGSTPKPILEKLAQANIRWKNVTIIPTDDRLVAVDNPLSNVAMIAKIFIIESALDARGQALVAFPGGSTPKPILEKLAQANIRWKNVTIIPTDDRLVAVDNPLSNVAMIAKIFIPKGARVLPITSDAADHKLAGNAANARLSDLHWPPDLVWLGMGADGHTASIFPGPDLDDALNGGKDVRAVGVAPDPLPPEAPVNRVTLTAAAIASARTTMLVISGAKKREVLEKAIEDGAKSAYPIGRVIDKILVPIDIYCLDE